MKDVPEGTVEVKAVAAPIPTGVAADGFQSLDLDAGGMKEMLGLEVEPEAPPVTPPATPSETPPATPPETPTPDENKLEEIPSVAEIPSELLGEPEPKVEETGDELSEEDKTLVESMDEKQKNAFISMRKELREFKKTKSEEAPAEVQKQLEEAQSKLAMYNLSESPAFQQKYIQPLRAKKEELVATAKSFGGTEARVNEILKMPDMKSRIQTFADEFPEISPILVGMMGDLGRINNEMVTAIKNHKVTKEELQKSQAENQIQELDTSINNARATLLQANHFLLKEADGHPEWNLGVNSRIDMAKEMSSKLVTDPSVRADVALRASMADTYLALYVKASAELRALNGHNKGVSSRKPGIHAAATPSAEHGAPRERTKEGMTGDDVGALLSARYGDTL